MAKKLGPLTLLAAVPLLTMGLQGCVALAVPALGSAASSGAGALVRAGASATRGGTVYRTFEAPLSEVTTAVQVTLARLEFPVPQAESEHERVTLRTEGLKRHLRIDLQPITPALTQVSATATISTFQQDAATAATVVDLVAVALGPAWPEASGLRRDLRSRAGTTPKF